MLAHVVQLNKFPLITFTFPMLQLVNLHLVVLKEYQKKILHSPYWIYLSSSKCPEFHFILLFIFLSKRVALKKQNFLEFAFQIKIERLHRQLYWDNGNVFIIHFEQLHQNSVSLKTINLLESFKSLWSHYLISWLL